MRKREKNEEKSRKVKFEVMVYDIAADRASSRIFTSEIAANVYAFALKTIWLNRADPAAMHIEVMPV